MRNFPANPLDGDTYDGYTYDQSLNAWLKDGFDSVTKAYVDSALAEKLDISQVSSPYGVAPVDEHMQVPTGSLAYIIDDAVSDMNTLGKISRNMFVVKTSSEWALETGIPIAGSINVEISDKQRYKIGDGINTFADLEYLVLPTDIPTLVADKADVSDLMLKANSNSPTFSGTVILPPDVQIGSITSTEILSLSGVISNIQDQLDAKLNTTDLQDNYAPKVSPTFSGTVTLPESTSIGNVAANEIETLNGIDTSVTIQTQFNNIDSDMALLAPLNSPTFTGTVSGITLEMIGGLENVDNTSDLNKPVSNATQDALDLKANISGQVFTGNVEAPNLTVTGDLYVAGTTVTVNTRDYAIRDNMVYMNQAGIFDIVGAVGNGTVVTYTTSIAHDLQVGDYVSITGISPSSLNIAGSLNVTITEVSSNTFKAANTSTETYSSGGTVRGKSAANPDIGFAAGYNDGSYHHTGFFRDASDGVWKIFQGYVPEPDEALFIDTADASFELADLEVNKLKVGSEGIQFADGIQAGMGVPSITQFIQKSTSYTLDSLSLRDNMIEVNNTSAQTITIPLDSSINFPIGTSIDILQSNIGQVTIAPAVGVTLNGTPGFKLRTRWSSATILKRAANTWLIFGDLTA